MKKLLSILLPLIILSCASLPNPGETTSGLLVIPSAMINKEGLTPFGNYRLTFTKLDDQTTITRRMPPSNSLCQIYFEPGKYNLSKVEFVYDHGGVHNETVGELSQTFTINHGEALIFHKKFQTKMYSKGTTHYMNRKLISTVNSDREKAIEYLSKLDNYGLWVVR